MMKNILKKFIQILRENLKLLILFMIIFIVFTFELPYYIETPGGIIDATKRIDIENSYNQDGSFNLAYVGQLKATLPTLLYAKINKDWEIISTNKVVLDNETIKDVEFRDHLMLEEANNTAIKLAYERANRKYMISNQELYITYIDEIAKTDMEVQDKIISIDNQNINNKKEMNEYIQKKKVGDRLKIKVINGKKKYDRYATIIKYKNKKMIGVMITEKQQIKTEPSIKIRFKNSESGASGGLMMTLNIYNLLIEEDLTKGLKIAGTGTIDEDGNVGEIDGVKYKLMGAVKNKADLFLVPDGNNYKEALKVKKEKGYKINIIKINTLDEAINYLKS